MRRPLASGVITKLTAVIIMLLSLIMSIIIIFVNSPKSIIILLIYLIMNIIYSLYLKNIAILDITIIAIGFILRLFIGSTTSEITLSSWIVVITFLLALFIVLAKRRDDVLICLNSGKKMRKAIDGYNLKFIDSAMAIMASVTIVSYIIFTTSSEVVARLNTHYLYLTSIFVILGILRFMQIAFLLEDTGSPTKIVFKDSFIQLTLLCWILFFTWIIY